MLSVYLISIIYGDSILLQMPVILAGQVICSVGTGLLTTIGTTTPTAVWATFLVLVGIGLGIGINAPHIAIQGVMERSVIQPSVHFVTAERRHLVTMMFS